MSAPDTILGSVYTAPRHAAEIQISIDGIQLKGPCVIAYDGNKKELWVSSADTGPWGMYTQLHVIPWKRRSSNNSMGESPLRGLQDQLKSRVSRGQTVLLRLYVAPSLLCCAPDPGECLRSFVPMQLSRG